MRQPVSTWCLLGLIIGGFLTSSVDAALTPAQRKNLKAIATDAGKIGSMISKKKFSEAQTAIKDIEDRITSFVADAGLKENDTNIKPLRTQVTKLKTQLTKAIEKAGETFEKNVAPIIAFNCVECHGNDPKGGLRLDTFEGMEKGGRSGFLLIPGEAEASLLIQRLITPDEMARMPHGKEPLSEKEILAIGNWISQGAAFEGDRSATMAALAKSAANKPAAMTKASGLGKQNKNAEISKETGKETVHFTRDIMPELVDTCGTCHNDKDKRSGFSVMSFEKLMKGGDSGSVISPGSLESSRLWRLVNADETPVMPAGNQTGITRKWHGNLRTWILEGAKFDGGDPKKAFPSLQEREAEMLSKLPPEQWLDKRKESADANWKKTFPNTDPNHHDSREFLVYGDVSNERLIQVDQWAGEQVTYLRQTFKVKDDPLWPGKLAVFVFKDRFGYEEFNNSVHRRETPRELIGHSQISASMEEAFVAMQDVGDAVSDASAGMRVNVIENVTSAFFRRTGRLPDWLVRGAGLAMAHQKSPSNKFLTSMPQAASRILQSSNLTDPQKIFHDGTFSTVDVGPVGGTLVEFFIKRGGIGQFAQFVQKLQSGAAPEAAIESVYRVDAKLLALAYFESLPSLGQKGNP